jgi:hypothetical protein
MGDPARNAQDDPLAIEGLDHVLGSDNMTLSDGAQVKNEYAPDTVGQVLSEKVSLTEAAIRLGVSERTIHRRITRGQLTAEKDSDGRVHVICPSPVGTVSVNVGQEPDSIDRLSDIVGQGDRKSNQDQLWDLVRQQGAKIEALTCRNGWLESQLHEREQDIKELKLLSDSQHRRGAWSRFWSWFTCAGR